MSSKEEIERLIDAFIKDFPRAISKLMGRRVGIHVTQLERREIVDKTEEIIVIFQELQRIKEKEIDSSKMLSKSFEVLDELMHSVIPEIPRDQHFVDWFIESYKNALDIPPALTYLEATHFKDHQNLISVLIWKMFSLGRKENVDKFLDQVSESEDAYILGQAFFTRLRNYYMYLQKEKIRVTRATLEKFVRIYEELAGHFEKYLRVIVGFLEILRNGITPNYNKIRRKSLAENERKVRKDKEFSGFVLPFNRTIRNAISHRSYVFDPLDRKIEFINLKHKFSIRYQDFIEQVRELSSLVLALSQSRLIALLYEFQLFKHFLEQE